MRRTTGFTLIELLVAMALGTILVGVVAFIFLNARRVYDHSLAEIATANELRMAFERVGRDLRDVLPAKGPGWEPIFNDVNGAAGPEDGMSVIILERGDPPTPVRVLFQLGAKDAEGLAPFTRRVTHRLNLTTNVFGATDPAVDIEEVLLPRVRTLKIEYAWPTPGVTHGHEFLRGAGGPATSPWNGPAASDGKRFYHSGTGSLVKGKFTMGSAWHTKAMPRRLAHTLQVTSATRPGTYPIVDILSPTELTIVGAPDGNNLSFWISMLPPAVQVSLRHEARNGPRSVTEVINLSP